MRARAAVAREQRAIAEERLGQARERKDGERDRERERDRETERERPRHSERDREIGSDRRVEREGFIGDDTAPRILHPVDRSHSLPRFSAVFALTPLQPEPDWVELRVACACLQLLHFATARRVSELETARPSSTSIVRRSMPEIDNACQRSPSHVCQRAALHRERASRTCRKPGGNATQPLILGSSSPPSVRIMELPSTLAGGWWSRWERVRRKGRKGEDKKEKGQGEGASEEGIAGGRGRSKGRSVRELVEG
eukprot:3505787-Rhodomonas_salina.1